MMNEQPKLSEAEWALVIDLLQQERDQLPAEIHHTRSAAFREELQRPPASGGQPAGAVATPAVC